MNVPRKYYYRTAALGVGGGIVATGDGNGEIDGRLLCDGATTGVGDGEGDGRTSTGTNSG